jgi:magnesium chelatase family protein
MNPCPCGMAGAKNGACRCSGEQIQRYLHRISGPLLDRIDIHVEVLRPRVPVLHLQSRQGECSGDIRARVLQARNRQHRRQGVANALLDVDGLRRHCNLDRGQESLLEDAAEQLDLSPRACHRILKLARTIADLDGEERIEKGHLAEAIALRQPALGRRKSAQHA